MSRGVERGSCRDILEWRESSGPAVVGLAAMSWSVKVAMTWLAGRQWCHGRRLSMKCTLESLIEVDTPVEWVATTDRRR